MSKPVLTPIRKVDRKVYGTFILVLCCYLLCNATMIRRWFSSRAFYSSASTDLEIQLIRRPPCDGFLHILVTSSVANVKLRDLIRQTWAHGRQVRFLLGLPIEASQQKDIDEEAAEYGDIVQGNFIDNYRNLTYKSLMGLVYARDVCRTNYTLRIDDDTYIKPEKIEKFLMENSTDFQCRLMQNRMVVRDSCSKWHVTEEEYPGQYYPDYGSGGFGCIMSPKAIRLLLEHRPFVQFFWIEDVYISGLLRERARLPINSFPPGRTVLYLDDYLANENKEDIFLGPTDLDREGLIVMHKVVQSEISKPNATLSIQV